MKATLKVKNQAEIKKNETNKQNQNQKIQPLPSREQKNDAK